MAGAFHALSLVLFIQSSEILGDVARSSLRDPFRTKLAEAANWSAAVRVPPPSGTGFSRESTGKRLFSVSLRLT